MQSAASMGFSSLENAGLDVAVTDDEGISDTETIEDTDEVATDEDAGQDQEGADDTDEVATDEKTSPDMAAAEDTGIGDTDTVTDQTTGLTTSGISQYGATVQHYDARQIDPAGITYYDIDGNKVEKTEYEQLAIKRKVETTKIVKEGYENNTSRFKDPALLRQERIKQWKSSKKSN